MKRIKKVNICGMKYKVEYVKDYFQSGAVHFGEIKYKSAKILLADDMTGQNEKETLCHEITHGILSHIGRDDLSNDETFVQSLSNAIYQGFEIKRA